MCGGGAGASAAVLGAVGKTVRLVVPAARASTDGVARLMAEAIGGRRAHLVVENGRRERMIGTEQVSRAAPDARRF